MCSPCVEVSQFKGSQKRQLPSSSPTATSGDRLSFPARPGSPPPRGAQRGPRQGACPVRDQLPLPPAHKTRGPGKVMIT